ncbi:SMI1/KNR4 family protein [Myroides marinus]|uniref:SMI1/KNR4 family protein n=1 Tax=Myroides marinus TaxID=703342 RepID=UPI002576F51B|nr:SMI1/KNR4 family protein [Myroides marinus]MDM1377859.1 SMI1/KNR4 family protein [Myroides marinus]MDM1384937.1 SMI1/KNR4 family protein [Myroides marinus]MDM1392343.1 SMI1/KNR4 family protein [Myroides marinus]
MYTEQIKRIKDKISQLEDLDQDLEVFGADTHEYTLNPVLDEKEVSKFEQEHKVTLPKDYVAFITQIGNGGVGPFYGLQTLAEASINEEEMLVMGNSTSVLLQKSFPHTTAWNPLEQLGALDDKIADAYDKGDEELEEELYEERLEIIGGEEHDYGRLNLCDYGCGITLFLVVTGEQKGIMWTDDRMNDGGLYPSIELENTANLSFLDWYELWLDNSIAEFE